MRFGYWLPVFGGWLRNVPDEGMDASWDYVSRLARRSEQMGYDLTLVAELNLNDIKGEQAASLDAWSTAAALAAVTRYLEIMVAVRPTFHQPALLAKQAANIDHISGGRLSLNVVSSWWAEEAKQYGVQFDRHDDRYARTAEWLAVISGLWREPRFSFEGNYYRVENTALEPKPVSKPRPILYAGGESPAAKQLIAQACDGYLMHGDPPERVEAKARDMLARRCDLGLAPLKLGVAAFVICRPTQAAAERELERITDVRPGSPGYANYYQWLGNTQLEQRVSLEDYSVSNRGLRAGLVGTPEQIAKQVIGFQEAGIDLLLLQCSPQAEEMERFAAEVMPLVRRETGRSAAYGVQGRGTSGIFDVMRPCLIATTALLLGCSPSPDVSPFPYGRAHADCGPADGPAVRIQLATAQLPGDLSVPPQRPSLDLVLNAGLTDASGQSFLIESEGRGQRTTAHAVLCGEDEHCVSAESGRVRLDSVREPPAEIRGTYDVTLDDGSRHSGRFTAAWIAFSPMCG